MLMQHLKLQSLRGPGEGKQRKVYPIVDEEFWPCGQRVLLQQRAPGFAGSTISFFCNRRSMQLRLLRNCAAWTEPFSRGWRTMQQDKKMLEITEHFDRLLLL